MKSMHCTIMRGGTSKGVFFHESELPLEKEERDKVILDVFGSPDIRQIDGLGGADILTSKVCIISRSKCMDADLDYTFGQVLIDEPKIDYSVLCGNLLAAVGPFAIDQALVKPNEPITRIRIYNTNTKKVFIAEVPVQNGVVMTKGDFKIDGVPGTGAKIALDFAMSGGTMNGSLLPTGNPRDVITIPGIGRLEVSIVDAASPSIFVRSEDVGLNHDTILASPSEFLAKAEQIRRTVNEFTGFISPAAPTQAFVGAPRNYFTITGQEIQAKKIAMKSVMVAGFRIHKAYAVAGAICTGTAAKIQGTIVNEITRFQENNSWIRVGHPSGIIEVEIDVSEENGKFTLKKALLYRTARKIMEGDVYLKAL